MAGMEAYKVLGFLFMSKRRHFTDPGVYADWINFRLSKMEMREELYFGQLPEGLIFAGPDGAVVVQGRCGNYKQKLVPLGEVVDGMSRSHDVGGSMGALIADHLVELRGILNMDQVQMAAHLDVSTMTVCRIESGFRNFMPKTAEKLLRLLPVYEKRCVSIETHQNAVQKGMPK